MKPRYRLTGINNLLVASSLYKPGVYATNKQLATEMTPSQLWFVVNGNAWELEIQPVEKFQLYGSVMWP